MATGSVITAFLKPREFATLANFYDVLASTALPAIMAQGAMLVISAGVPVLVPWAYPALISAQTSSNSSFETPLPVS